MSLGTKPECALESVTKEAWYTSLLRIRIDDRRARRLTRLAHQVGCALRGKGGAGECYEQSLNVSLNQQDTSKRSYCGFTSESMTATAGAG